MDDTRLQAELDRIQQTQAADARRLALAAQLDQARLRADLAKPRPTEPTAPSPPRRTPVQQLVFWGGVAALALTAAS